MLAFNSGVAQIFVGLSVNRVPQIINKRVTIRGVRWPDVGGDVIAEIFSLPRLGSPACVAWCTVLLADVGSSSSYLLNQGQSLLSQGT